ncbi:MAG: RNA polymerase sigma factor SigZ [Bacteroidales bacterium]
MDKNSEIIWRQFSRDLDRFIRSRVNDPDIAGDLLQETFLRIHNHIGSLKDETRLQAWIFQITRNVIADHFRRQEKENRKYQNLNEESGEPVNEAMTEAVHDMIKMMDSLPPEYCQALCLTELEGLSQKEYAEKLGISYSGAKSRVQRARKMLRDMLMQCCHYQFDRYGTVIDIFPAGCCCCEDQI